MKNKLKQFSLLALSVLAVPALVSAPVFAVSGSDDPAPTPTATSTPKPPVTPKPTVSPTPTTKKDLHKLTESEVNERVNTFNTKAQATVKALEAKKAAAKARTTEERKTSCEARSTELANRLKKKVADAEKHQAVFDKIYDRVKAFHDSKNLSVTDYDALIAKADAAKVTASDSIASLKKLNITVDCSDPTAVATQVAAFKEALGQTRDSLKAYRTSIKNITVAIKASLPDASPTAKPTTSSSSTPTPTTEATPTPTPGSN